MFIVSAGVTLSKYTTSSYGSDSARVVSMGNVTIIGDSGLGGSVLPLQLAPGVDLQENLEVAYDPGEVSCYVFFTIDNLNCHGSTYYYGENIGNAWFQFNVPHSWDSFSRGSETVWYVLVEPGEVFHGNIINGGLISVSDEFTRSELEAVGDLGISISASALQYNGTDSPEVAYDRIKHTGGN